MPPFHPAKTAPAASLTGPVRPSRWRARGAVLALAVVVLAVLGAPGAVSAQATGDLELSTTVYTGHDDGEACPGDESVVAVADAPVTWCFFLHNGTDSNLASVTLDVAGLDIDQTDVVLVGGGSVTDALALVPPGGDVHLYYESDVASSLLPVGTASGAPADQAGDPIVGADPVTAVDGAGLVLTEVAVDKTVYDGHDAGAGCPGIEKVIAEAGDQITYCFSVTNSGDTTLAPVTVDDVDLGLTDADMTVLSGDLSSMAPGDTAVLYTESTVDGDLTNTASVEGTAVDEAGDPIADVDPIVAEDTAEVDEVVAALSVVTEVLDPYTDEYLDADSDHGTAGTNDPRPATLAVGETASFRFGVTNDGAADLSNVALDAPGCDGAPTYLDGDEGEPDVLEPEERWHFTCEVTDVEQGFTLEATADADVDGDEDAPAPDGAGKVEVARVQVAATAIEVRVNDPATGDFGDTAVIAPGDDARFEIVVHNTGEAPLSDLVVSDDEAPECARTFADVLAPGESLAAYECSVADVEGGFVNTASVAGVPVDDEGSQVADEVKAESSAVVTTAVAAEAELIIDKSLAGAEPGTDTAIWQITVANAGAVAATEPIVVIDELPTGLVLVQASGDGWECSATGESVRCATDADLEPGQVTAALVLDTQVRAAVGTTVTNVAYVEGADGVVAQDDAVLSVTAGDGGADPFGPTAPVGALPRTGATAIAGLVALATLLIGGGSLLTSVSRRQG